jgi:hypothetical protein
MSVRVSSSPALGEDRAEQASLLRGSLKLNEAEEPWAPKKKISEPFVPLHPGPGSQQHETMDIPPVSPAMAAPLPPPPVNLPSRPRKDSQPSQMIQVMPRVSTSVAQLPVPPPPQRSVSTDVESGDSPVKSSRVSFRMSSSTATSQGPDSQGPGRLAPSNAVVTAESRRIRPGSATEIEWQRIQKLRVDNWSLRSQIREMRSNLRQIQRAKSDADDILIRRMTVQFHGLDNFLLEGQKTLKELLDDCQVARDAYGPVEDDCNRLEDRLSAQEFELDRLEEHFYSRPLEEANVFDRPLTPAEINDTQPYSSSADEEDEEDEYHPLVSQYLSKQGDLDLLRERLDDLRDDKRTLEEQRETRRRIGMTLDPESQRWLENAQSAENELRRNIRALQKDLEMMKQDCLSKGLIDEDGEPTGFETREQRSFNDEEEMSPLDQKSEYVKYPLLLPHPGIKPTMDFHYEPRPDEKSDPTTITNSNMKLLHLPHPLKHPSRSAMYNLLSNLEKWNSTARINEWILHRLRGSALEVNLLASTFQGISGDITDRWQIAVLRLWFRDATMQDKDGGVRVSTNSMTTQAPAISNPSADQIKIPGGNGAVEDLPFSELVSQSAGSSIDDDEVEIVEYRPRRRQKISSQPLRM